MKGEDYREERCEGKKGHEMGKGEDHREDPPPLSLSLVSSRLQLGPRHGKICPVPSRHEHQSWSPASPKVAPFEVWQ